MKTVAQIHAFELPKWKRMDGAGARGIVLNMQSTGIDAYLQAPEAINVGSSAEM